MMLYTVALVLVHAVLAVQGGHPFHRTHPAADIEALCADKPVELLSVGELRHTSMVIGKSSCSSHVQDAVAALLVMIDETKGDSCAQESIDKLRNFYAKYLDTSSKENKKREQLPKSLRKFAIAYGMQMSSACKRRMVNVLTGGDGDILQDSSHKTIKHLVSAKSPVADMLESIVGPDEILLPGDLAPYIKAKQSKEAAAAPEDDNIYIQSATAPYVRKLQSQCTEVFAPIYKPLIKPIVQLANMGFNYKDEPLRCDMGCTRKSQDLADWSRLVFFCESLNNIHVVGLEANDTENKDVRILTKEEAVVIGGETAIEPHVAVAERVYGPVNLHSDLIFNKGDKQLKKAIKAFSTSKSEEEKAAKRMMRKGVSLFKTQLKRHKFGVLMSTGIRAVAHRIKTGENLKAGEEIIRVLDGAISHEKEFRDDSPTLPKHLDNEWDAVKEIASEIGSLLATALMGILAIALISFAVAVVILNFYLLGSFIG